MGRNKKGRGSFDAESEDFVPAVFARTADEAEEYCELLNDHDIPAIVNPDEEEGPAKDPRSNGVRKGSRGVPVLVPEALLDEASEVIADRDYDDIKPGEEPADDEEEDDAEGLSPERPGGGHDEAAEEEDEEGPEPKDDGNPFEGDEDAFDLDEEDEDDPDEADLEEEEDEEEEGEEEVGDEDEEEDDEEEGKE